MNAKWAHRALFKWKFPVVQTEQVMRELSHHLETVEEGNKHPECKTPMLCLSGPCSGCEWMNSDTSGEVKREIYTKICHSLFWAAMPNKEWLLKIISLLKRKVGIHPKQHESLNVPLIIQFCDICPFVMIFTL